MKFHFESAMEKLARILARQYHIEVVFEGSSAKTDGKKIYLPNFESLTDDLKQDLNGFLDHEVAHCKFTEFAPYQAIRKKLVQELANSAEDIRIERAMVNEYSGTYFNLSPLRDKVAKETKTHWSKIPAMSRIITNVQWIMEGREPIIDEDIKRYMDKISPVVATLNDCKSTQEIIVKCEKIAQLLEEEREEEREEQSDESQEDQEKSKGKSGDSSGSKSDSEGESDKDSEGESDQDSEGEGEGDESESPSSGLSDEDGKEFDEMMDESVGDKKKGESKFDKFSSDLEDFMNDKLKDHIKKEGKFKPGSSDGYTHDVSGKSVSKPFTTRFDKETDHSGKGSYEKYNTLKKQVRPLVAPIKAQLERVLKVKENARWRMEREEGRINSRSLARLGSDKGYRQIFKDYTKVETNNVAVEILVDMSGSMGGKMQTAKMTTIAMAEALNELNIPFEVTGFYSKEDDRMRRLAVESKTDYKTFNRIRERLELHVFKSFDVASLTGIEKLFVGEQNPDGECVKWAATRLALRKEKRKILLVLSDGQPATGEGDNRKLQSDLKIKIQQIEKSGIECVGVGIQTEAPKHYYKDYIVVNNVASLPKEAMGKLAKLIGE